MGINFKKLQEKSNDDFTPLPENRYNLAVDSGELKTSKAGNKMIEVTFKVIDDEEHNNRKLWHIFSLVDNAQFYLLKFLEAADSDIIESDAEVEPKDIIQDIIGRKVNAYVTVKGVPGKDKKRNEIDGAFKGYQGGDTTTSNSSTTTKQKGGGGKNLFK